MLMLAQRFRLWANIKSALVQCLVFAERPQGSAEWVLQVDKIDILVLSSILRNKMAAWVKR